jgi:dTDP-glucose 4,6-dehydratase
VRVAVTGGAGFVGAHLCRALHERGDEVICIDNLSTSWEANLEVLSRLPRLRFIRADISEGFPDCGKLDAVAHLASPASPPDYQRLALETLRVGASGTEACLKEATRQRARFLLTSTSEVYGEPAVHPQVEEYWGNVNPTGPRSMYDEAKRFAEALTSAYRSRHATRTGIVRVFNTYGPGMRPDDGRVVPSFITSALTGDPLTCFGGTQTRSLCYVDDLVAGLVTMLDTDVAGPVNIGNNFEISVADLAVLVLRLTRSASRIEIKPVPVDDPSRRCPDISLAVRVLGWAPKVSLEEGLSRTIEAFNAALSLSSARSG